MDPAAVLLGVPGNKQRPMLQLGGMDWDSDHATAEWLQTIDINVIQPTPNISPCSSMRSVSDQTGSFDQSTLHLASRSVSRQSTDVKSELSDSSFCEETTGSFDESNSTNVGARNRRATQYNLLNPTNSQASEQSLLGLPATAHLSGSCEKLTIQPMGVTRQNFLWKPTGSFKHRGRSTNGLIQSTKPKKNK